MCVEGCKRGDGRAARRTDVPKGRSVYDLLCVTKRRKVLGQVRERDMFLKKFLIYILKK